jgi:epoxyqueuosine reductase
MLLEQAVVANVKAKAIEVGFDFVGIAPAAPSQYKNYLRRWLDEGRAGTMRWLADRFDERADVTRYLPGARSVVCVAMNYFVPLKPPADAKNHGRVARYALGDDYHDVMKRRLHHLADWLREQFPEARTRACVDTAPLLEKELAALAGVGWIGKNTCVIRPGVGSWFLLGEVVTTLPLSPDKPATDHCGTCTRCIDACPTDAIVAPYEMDARRCISYLTIEHREAISDDQAAAIDHWLYGCDICQDVCPHNHRPPTAASVEVQPHFDTGTLDVDEVANWSDDEYRRRLRGSAMKRVKLPMLQRNAKIVTRNLESPAITRNDSGPSAVS